MKALRGPQAFCLALLVAGPNGWATRTAAQPEQEAGPIALTYSMFFPATHRHTLLAAEWAEEIARRTDNRVQITIVPGGALTPADQCYDGVEKGLSDIGMSVLGYTRGRFPLSEVLDLPLGYPSGAVATELVNAFYVRFAPSELGDVKVMYLHAHGPGFLHTKVPVTSLEGLKGMRIRCTGLAARIVTALGGTPVAMPMGETYDALSRGVVEGSMAPMESLQGWKWGEVVASSTQAFRSAYTTTFFVAMNRGAWDSLPPDIQQAIAAVNEEWAERTGKGWDAMDQAARDYIATRGNALIALSEAEDARWAEAVQPVLDEYVASMATRGLPGRQALEFCQAFLAERR